MQLFPAPPMPAEALPFSVRTVLGRAGALQAWERLWDRGVAMGLEVGFFAGAVTAALLILGIALLVMIARRSQPAVVVALLVALVVLAATRARAQIPQGAREIETTSTVFQGHRATSPISDANRIQNEGGSNGAGLCVIASAVQCGQEAGVPMCLGGKNSELWRKAKGRPGGYGPGKLAALLNEIDPDETWFSYVGTDLSVLRSLTRMGYRVGHTYSYGDKYRGRIHHMVSGEDDSDKWGCVADNNRSGPPTGPSEPQHTWMTRTELERRVFDGSTYWVFGWTRRPVMGGSKTPWLISAGILGFGTLVTALEAVGKFASGALAIHTLSALRARKA